MDTKKGSKYGKRNIRYKDYPEADMDDKVILPVFAYSAVVCSHTKRYHNCLYLLAGLNSCSRDLMDYITEEMESDNTFSSNAHFRQRFINFIKANVTYTNTKTNTEETLNYSDASVKKGLALLAEKKLIRSIQKGVYKVNPLYFWKNDEKNRDNEIVLELEFKSGYDTKLETLKTKTGITDVREDRKTKKGIYAAGQEREGI